MKRYILVYRKNKYNLLNLYSKHVVCSSSSLNLILTFLQENKISSKNVFLPVLSLYNYTNIILRKRLDIDDLCS